MRLFKLFFTTISTSFSSDDENRAILLHAVFPLEDVSITPVCALNIRVMDAIPKKFHLILLSNETEALGKLLSQVAL